MIRYLGISTLLVMFAIAAVCGVDAPAAEPTGAQIVPMATSSPAPTATPDPGTTEIRVTESSVSFAIERWGEGEPYLPAPANYYDDYDWATSPTTERPVFMNEVVVHRSLSPNVGIKGLANSTVAERGSGEMGHGFSYGLLWSEDSTVNPVDDPDQFGLGEPKEVGLNVERNYAPYLLFETHSAFEGTVLVTAIVDYEQVPFEMDGISGRLHEFKTLPGRTLIIPVDFGILPPGAHDIQLVMFDDPYSGYGHDDHLAALRAPLGFQLLQLYQTGMRRRVIVGGDPTPARELIVQDVGSLPPSGIKAGEPVSFGKTGTGHPREPGNYLEIDDVDAGGEYAFKMRTSRWAQRDGGTNAVMLFVDYLQVPFNDDTVYTAVVGPGEEAVIDTSIQLPEAAGDHQLFGTVIFDPYRNLEDGRYELPEASNQKLVINTS